MRILRLKSWVRKLPGSRIPLYSAKRSSVFKDVMEEDDQKLSAHIPTKSCRQSVFTRPYPNSFLELFGVRRIGGTMKKGLVVSTNWPSMNESRFGYCQHLYCRLGSCQLAVWRPHPSHECRGPDRESCDQVLGLIVFHFVGTCARMAAQEVLQGSHTVSCMKRRTRKTNQDSLCA